jgi:hypothetical protein
MDGPGAGGGEDFSKNTREGGFADAALAVEDCVLAGLKNGVDEHVGLLLATGEQAVFVNGGAWAEDAGQLCFESAFFDISHTSESG